MYAKAGELGLPVGHMPFKGFMLHAGRQMLHVVTYLWPSVALPLVSQSGHAALCTALVQALLV
jgi:hypothetical protein